MSVDTSALKLHRMRKWVDEAIDKWGAMEHIDSYSEGFIDGMGQAYMNIKVMYLLTPDESAEMERARREMFESGGDA